MEQEEKKREGWDGPLEEGGVMIHRPALSVA
jgi:hypothetical protein